MADDTPPSKIVLVTGANQGLGHAVIEVAGLRYPFNTYILCSRHLENGASALAKLRQAGVKAKVDLVQLEVTNDNHITAAVEFVKTKYGRLDVLVNNAGFVRMGHVDTELSALRSTYNEYLEVHVTSVAVITHAFMPLLHKAVAPRVINVTSGLGSITNVLSSRRMGRVPPYGASKVGMNGLTAHLQVGENDRVSAAKKERAEEEGEGDQAKSKAEAEAEGQGQAETNVAPRIRFFISNPGVLKTAFANYISWGKEPQAGAESIVQLLGDDDGRFDHGMQWEFEEGEMRIVPW